MNEGAGAGGKIGVKNVGGDGYGEAGGAGVERFVDTPSHFGRGGVAISSDAGEGINHSEHRAKKTEEGGDVGDGEQGIQIALKAGDFELPGFLGNGFEIGAGGVMAADCGVNDAGDGTGGAGAFMEGFGVILTLNEIAQAVEKIRDVDRRTMIGEEALGEDAETYETARQNRPDEEAAFGNEFE